MEYKSDTVKIHENYCKFLTITQLLRSLDSDEHESEAVKNHADFCRYMLRSMILSAMADNTPPSRSYKIQPE